MKTNRLLMLSLLLAPLLASAHNLQLQQRTAPIGVSDQGELSYVNDIFSYQNWNSAKLSGKVRVVQHIAGRTSAKEMNQPLIDAIKAAKLPRDRYQTTTIVNTDDAIIGTAMFVRNSIESSKNEFPWSQFIIDSNGNVKKAWELHPKSSTIIVLDNEGKIQFVKDGPLTTQEVQHVMSLLQQLLN